MITKLEHDLGYTFKDKALLNLALTHRSFAISNNERLEFLGDAMLSAVIADHLFAHNIDFSEGSLSQARALLVNKNKLAELAIKLSLAENIILGNSEKNNLSKQAAIMADAMEAIVGAIFVDGGWCALKSAILPWFLEDINKIVQHGIQQHPKTALQEWTQANGFSLPKYRIIKQLGPQHDCQFLVECKIKKIATVTTGQAATKQIAEEMAAKSLLDILELNKHD